ncbi:ER to Golgi transporter [Madurella fahalii]|uniref:ER to Golgi transporter n=1 Tax=Madurella fahalii TaxID=1157608 RepID=A0ABQ0G5N3_9PEZI
MPHSTSHSSGSHMRAASQTRPSTSTTRTFPETDDSSAHAETEKFPDFDVGHAAVNGQSTNQRWQQNGFAYGNGSAKHSSDRWHARRDSRVRWAPRDPPSSGSAGHARGNSIGNAFHRMRSGSMSQNAHEIADALRAPVSWKLIALCIMWYSSSALTNTSSKTILTAFDKPATLTLVQFGFVSSYCMLFSWLASTFPWLRTAIPALKHPIRYPSRDVIKTTLPLAAFQIGGHLLSSNATSKIPVSLVHTIKGLSPLFTVLAYRFIFDIRYPRATYLSLIPLTVGVFLACSGNRTFGGQFLGILYALFAAMIFVTQNIFSKRLFNEAARAEQEGPGGQSRKLDKLNLLCYSSGMAFLLTGPIWFWSEGIDILGDFLWDGSVDLIQSPNSLDHGPLVLEYIFNGTFHFGQNILAFVLLSMVSPVTYSVASLIKRVFVIIIAILWFRSPTTKVQAAGIGLTFLGLYLYDRSNAKNKADQRARSMTETRREQMLLPLSTKHGASLAIPAGQGNSGQNGTTMFESPVAMSVAESGSGHVYTQSLYSSNAIMNDPKKSDDVGRVGGARGAGNAAWLPPGTRQEDTWRAGDNNAVAAR